MNKYLCIFTVMPMLIILLVPSLSASQDDTHFSYCYTPMPGTDYNMPHWELPQTVKPINAFKCPPGYPFVVYIKGEKYCKGCRIGELEIDYSESPEKRCWYCPHDNNYLDWDMHGRLSCIRCNPGYHLHIGKCCR